MGKRPGFNYSCLPTSIYGSTANIQTTLGFGPSGFQSQHLFKIYCLSNIKCSGLDQIPTASWYLTLLCSTPQFLPPVNPLKMDFHIGKKTYLRLKPFLPLIGLMWKIRVCSNVNLFSDLLSKSDTQSILRTLHLEHREHILHILHLEHKANFAHRAHTAKRTLHFVHCQSHTQGILHITHKEYCTQYTVKVKHRA